MHSNTILDEMELDVKDVKEPNGNKYIKTFINVLHEKWELWKLLVIFSLVVLAFIVTGSIFWNEGAKRRIESVNTELVEKNDMPNDFVRMNGMLPLYVSRESAFVFMEVANDIIENGTFFLYAQRLAQVWKVINIIT